MCATASYAGELLASLPGQTLGKPRWVVRFFCQDHPANVGIFCANLFQYKFLGRRGQGIYFVQKLTEAEQNHRAVLREKQRGRGTR